MKLTQPFQFSTAIHPQKQLAYQHITHEMVLANGITPAPQYKLSLFSEEGVVILYLANSDALNNVLKLTSTTPQLTLKPNEAVLAVHMVYHPLGWPKRQKPQFHLFKAHPKFIKHSATHIPIVRELPYLTCPTPSLVILDPGVFKQREVFPYTALGTIHSKGQWVVIQVKPSKTKDRCTRIAVMVADRTLVGRLVGALTEQNAAVLTINEHVRVILLFAQDCSSVTVLGVENLGYMKDRLKDLKVVNERWVAKADWRTLDLPY